MKRLVQLLIPVLTLSLVSAFAYSQEIPRGAVRLGERAVDFHANRDVIPVGAYDGSFKDILVWVEKNNVELFNLVVTYGNGQRQSFATRLVFDRGTRSRVLHLEGGRRLIRSISFAYRTVGTWAEGRARVVVYGIR